MRLLLDTHIALWAIIDSPNLTARIRELIIDPGNIITVSTVSVWEIAIKHALARGKPTDMPISGAEALHYFRAAGYVLLNISPEHAAAVEQLPDLHADPFDRLLVAQSMVEPLRLLTHDAKVAAYSDQVILL
ncbi:type II toxin-antitoxin system VapC family toxin (plasmid) [Skermanella rosea]|uniref:type II toxin-antitoxin system VapC family toxin n=1 Tax=Skermanella rosea TaxID=1817965 RepID=UPI001934A2AC|nr:type II toxin-antitoxin system VapC family toxin [Skermanella rosea]UEM06836.1 type II toxin-antitoxin system VapC family toxin [Skermanella rosea]